MLEGWASELSMVVWLDAPDPVLWSRINERSQDHRTKGDETDAGHSFIARYRRSFDSLLHRLEELGGPEVLRFDTSTPTAEKIVETVGPLLAPASALGSDREGEPHGR